MSTSENPLRQRHFSLAEIAKLVSIGTVAEEIFITSFSFGRYAREDARHLAADLAAMLERYHMPDNIKPRYEPRAGIGYVVFIKIEGSEGAQS